MQIIDINGIERTIKANPVIVIHTRSNTGIRKGFENVDGELVARDEVIETEVEEKYAEVMIVGNSRVWQEWYPLEKFEEMNPWFTERV